jgi:transglutaminase-like putative cysteine protease
VLVFGGILVLVIALSPEIRSDQLRRLFESNVQQSSSLENLKINIFSSVSSKETMVKSTDQDTLRFNSRPNLSEDIQFRITSSGVPNYWRVRRYDIYNQWGWSTSPYKNSLYASGESQPPGVTPAEEYIINYTVQNKVKTDVILSSGQYLFASVPNIIHYYETPNPDTTINPDDNIVSVSTPHIYQVDDRYTVNSEIIRPTIEQLQAAKNFFPSWISGRYLQLPGQFPDTIATLSRSLTRRNTNEYDKVMAVTNYLARFKYVLEGTYPPEDKDAVSDFLFTQKAGNCTNFASAAVVMLRSVNIPARLCTGYIPHYVDKTNKTFVVLAKDYHAWPEVYFPGYGWIEFEVTPGTALNANLDGTPDNNLPGLSSSSINDFPAYFPGYLTPTPATSGNNPSANSQKSQKSYTGIILLVIFILMIAAFITLSIIWRKKMKRQNAISGIMAKMHLISPLIGVPFRSSQTIQEYAEYLSARLPHHRLEIEKLTQIYQFSRYSRSKLVVSQDESLISRYWRSLFWGMLKRTLIRF